MTLESVFPYFKHGAGRRRQRWHNVGMIAVAALVNAAIGTLAVLPIAWSEASSFGLLYRLTGHSAGDDRDRRIPRRPLELHAARHDAQGARVVAYSPRASRRHRARRLQRYSPAPVRAALSLGSTWRCAVVARRSAHQLSDLYDDRAAVVPAEPQQHEISGLVRALGQLADVDAELASRASQQPSAGDRFALRLRAQRLGPAVWHDAERPTWNPFGSAWSGFRGPDEQTVWALLRMPFKAL